MSNLQFREKLLPPFWAWLFLIGISLMLSISMSAIFGTNFAVAVFVIVSTILCLITYIFSPELKIDSQYFHAGKAKLPLKIITQIETLNALETTQLRGIRSDFKAFHAISPLISTAIKIEFDDPTDPHSYWLVSTRKGQKIKNVLQIN
ncbi:MAG: hypothetical protein RLZZ37_1052 [Actinomycetota bacterium]|jgi:hypothetical protein